MAQSLSEQDLYDLVGAKTHLKPKSVERVWDVIKEIITSELQNNDSINLRNFGTFKKVAKGGDDEWVLNSFGLQEKKYIAPYDFVTFEPSKNYIALVNSGYTKPMTRKSLMKYEETETVDTSDMANDIAVDPSVLEIVDKVFKDKEKPRRTHHFSDGTQLPYKGKKVKCLDTGVTYNSILEMSQHIPVPYMRLYRGLRDGKTQICGFTFEMEDDFIDKKENEFDKQIREENLH